MAQYPEIKVCGMRDEANIKALCDLQPNYIGFIFYRKSPRYIGEMPDVAIDPTIKRVGVFVNASERTINEKRVQFGLDILQLHGDESPELCFLLRQSGAQVMKVFRVDENFDFQQTQRYEDYCDYFLFDTETKAFGGSGKKFDWHLLQAYKGGRPIFLSGGIGPNDIREIQQQSHLKIKAIDINSKFEVAPALKNIKLLEKFIIDLRKTN